jgi:hypothetical protein
VVESATADESTGKTDDPGRVEAQCWLRTLRDWYDPERIVTGGIVRHGELNRRLIALTPPGVAELIATTCIMLPWQRASHLALALSQREKVRKPILGITGVGRYTRIRKQKQRDAKDITPLKARN